MKMKYILPAVISVFFAKSIYADPQVFNMQTHGVTATSAPVKAVDMEEQTHRISFAKAPDDLDATIFLDDWARLQNAIRENTPEMTLVKNILTICGFGGPIAHIGSFTSVMLAPTLDHALETLEGQVWTVIQAQAMVAFMPTIPTKTVATAAVEATPKKGSLFSRFAKKITETVTEKIQSKATALLSKSAISSDEVTKNPTMQKVKAFWGKTKETIKTGIRNAVQKVAPLYVKVKNWFV